jgi:hypothetical protein
MTNVEKAESLEHRRLVEQLVDWMKQEGVEVKCADCDNYVACDKWKEESDEYVPDARGIHRKPDLLCYGEAKIAEDIDKDHTKAQFKEFSNYVMPGDKGQDCPFFIAIPKGSEETLKKVLRDLGLMDKPHVKWLSF